jgi:carboxymethylenebutenolidase
MDGGYALERARQKTSLAAYLIHYAILITDRESLKKKILAALLGNFAGQDRGLSPEDVQKFEQTAAPGWENYRHQNLP